MGDNQSQLVDLQPQGNTNKSECELLAYLTQVLNQRPEQSLLLSDLGALLPDPLRVAIRENGGLRTCVQKFPIFKVSGQPGRERVTLLLGVNEPDPSILESVDGVNVVPSELNSARELDDDDSDENDRSIVQLRGLPYRATEEDIRKFLGPHLAHLKDDNAIELLLSRDGRPSGFARVCFSCPVVARAACSDLHERVMNIDVDPSNAAGSSSRHRYVEVFLYSEHPGKVRFKKSSVQNGLQEDVDPALEAEAAQISPDQIATEVRVYMAQEGKGELLLSMLGVALSPAARLYLRKSDRGVKRFLAQYPSEFLISGEKGRERITYISNQGHVLPWGNPSVGKVVESNLQAEHFVQYDTDGDDDVVEFDAPPSPRKHTWASPDVAQGSRPPFSKLAMSPLLATPSNWGTPDFNQGPRPDITAAMLAEDPGNMMQSMWMPWQVNFVPPPDPRVSLAAAVHSDVVGPPEVRLRGLPFDTTEQDVLSFFAQQGVADRVAEVSNAVEVMSKSNGKPSGHAVVQLRRAQDVDVVQRALHMANLGNRYVEVLPRAAATTASSSQAPKSKLQQESVNTVEVNAMPNIAPQMMAGSTLYSDAWFLSQLAVSVAQCSPEHEFFNSYNAGLKAIPRDIYGRECHGLQV